MRIPTRQREPDLRQGRAGCSNRQARHLHEGGRSGAEHVRAQVVGSGEHKEAAVGFHRLLSLRSLSFKAACPMLHGSLVGQECHCVRLLSFFLDEHCKTKSFLLLLDLMRSLEFLHPLFNFITLSLSADSSSVCCFFSYSALKILFPLLFLGKDASGLKDIRGGAVFGS